MKEMVGGCCVCSDESGWDENPLVYCDGEGCDVAVHQACYGIVTVPLGPWFCRKCESRDRSSDARCELCPAKGGALKATDTGRWAHVLCALYIPEVRFGDVATMEPVLVSIVPPERFNKPCCLCEMAGRTSRAATGATMSCNRTGCRQSFHVTCAQAQGLLCEEQVQSMNVTYCGYCPHHYAKLKRGHHVKVIPAFKPSRHAITPDASPEKQPPQGDALRAERRHKKSKPARSPRASAASPPPPAELSSSTASSSSTTAATIPAAAAAAAVVSTTAVSSAAPETQRCAPPKTPDAPPPPPPLPLSVVKTEPVSGEADGVGAVRFTSANFTESVVAPSGAVFGGQDGVQIKQEPDSRGETEPSPLPPPPPPPVTSQPAAAGAAGQVASLPVAASTALSSAQLADPDSSSLKRPAPATADKEPRKRKQPGRPRKQASGAASPDQPALGGDGDWTGAGAPTATAGAVGRSGGSGAAPVPALGGLTAPHMIGNQLNPAAPLGDSLAAEMAEQADYLEPTGPLQALADRTAVTPAQWRPDTAAAPFPRSLTELLERQWQQGSHFLMEQAQQMDISALLSCLYQLRQENQQMEQHMSVVSQRRDHLLAVHARLSVPLESVASSVVSARAAAVRHQRAADADLQAAAAASQAQRATPPPSVENGAAEAARLPAPAARSQTNGRTGSVVNGATSAASGPRPTPPPAPVITTTTAAAAPVSQPASEHRTVEALRLRVSATSSGGIPQYQLVSPPADGRSAAGRSRASDS